ncbi:MAG: hypothetical protein ACOX8K_09925 [Lachnospiraceae bacterium]
MAENICIDTWIFPVMGISLTFTIAIECLTALLWGMRKPLSLLLTAAVNLLTNPAVVAAYYLIGSRITGGKSSWVMTAAAMMLEAAAICAEAVCYKWADQKMRRPWLFSLTANMASYWIGVGIQRLI